MWLVKLKFLGGTCLFPHYIVNSVRSESWSVSSLFLSQKIAMYSEDSLQMVFSKLIHLLKYKVLAHTVSQDLLPFYVLKSPSLLIKLLL